MRAQEHSPRPWRLLAPGLSSHSRFPNLKVGLACEFRQAMGVIRQSKYFGGPVQLFPKMFEQ